MKKITIEGKVAVTMTILVEDEDVGEAIVAHLNNEADDSPVPIPDQKTWEVDLDSHSDWEVIDCHPA